MKKENLIKESNYARYKGVSSTCISKWRKQGKIKNTIIDGVNFVELSDEELVDYNKWKNK